MLSITETQYSGANVIVVAPDSDNLSVLQVVPRALALSELVSLSAAPSSSPRYRRMTAQRWTLLTVLVVLVLPKHVPKQELHRTSCCNLISFLVYLQRGVQRCTHFSHAFLAYPHNKSSLASMICNALFPT